MTGERTDRGSIVGAVGGLLIAMASFQVGASIAKQLIPAVGAVGTTTLRLGLAAILVTLIQRPWRAVPRGRAARMILAYGLVLGAMNLSFYMAIRTIPLGIAVAIEFSGPLALAMISSRRAIDFMWIALAVAGLSLLLPLNVSDARLDPLGILFALLAGTFWALYIVFGQKAGSAHGSTTTAAWGMIVAALLVVPIGAVTAGRALLSPSILPFGLAVATLSSALPYTLEMIALRRLPATTFGTLMSLEPALAAIAGLIFLDERLTSMQWTAVLAIVVASIGTTAGAKSALEAA